jgi:hypothetical protein
LPIAKKPLRVEKETFERLRIGTLKDGRLPLFMSLWISFACVISFFIAGERESVVAAVDRFVTVLFAVFLVIILLDCFSD